MTSATQRPPAAPRSDRRAPTGVRHHRVASPHAPQPMRAVSLETTPQAAASIHPLSLAEIKANERNPRQRLRDIPELASSLQTYGLLQPVVVRPVDGGYVLLAGHRRVEAARSLGWEVIPAIVRPATDDEAYLLTVVDN